MKLTSFLIFIVCLPTLGFGVNDSTSKETVRIAIFNPGGADSLWFNTIDTNISKFYSFYPDGGENIVSLGNFGLATKSILFKSNNYGFVFDDNIFVIEDDSERYIYNAKQPFVRASYISGPKKIQDFKILFSSNISKAINFTVAYETFGSTGTYINQNTKGNIFKFQFSFIDADKRYGNYLKFDVNSGKVNENGGIKGDSIYSELIKLGPLDSGNNKLKVQVWQEGALNHFDHRDFELIQFLSLKRRSSSGFERNGFSIIAKTKGFYDDVWYDDENSDSLYFDKFNLQVKDSSDVFDKSHVFGLENRFDVEYYSNFIGALLYSGVDLNLYEYKNLLRTTNLDQVGLNIGFSGLNIVGFSLEGEFKKGLTGFNSNGYNGTLTLNHFMYKKMFKFSAKLETIKTLPLYKYLDYASNIQSWENNFKYVKSSSLSVDLVSDSLNLYAKVKLYTINEFVYISNSTVPIQATQAINGVEINVGKGFQFGDFHVDLNVIYQNVGDQAPIRVPKLLWKSSIYHQRYIFNNAMELRYGVDYWQHTAYHSNYYAPFSRSFVLQDKYEVGNYPYIDVFASARIKSAQIFVKFQNVGQFVFRENYMMVPFYPLQDFGISFGVSWDFYN